MWEWLSPERTLGGTRAVEGGRLLSSFTRCDALQRMESICYVKYLVEIRGSYLGLKVALGGKTLFAFLVFN